MIRFDPNPWLLLVIPFLMVAGYLTWRGFTRNEFRVPGKWGWETSPRGSLFWYLGSFGNVVFVGAGLFMLYQGLFNGSNFSREPVFPMPELRGEPIETAEIARRPESLARCIADLDHGKLYQPTPKRWRVAVRNGRNALMYTFEITPAGTGSHLAVYRSLPSPFVSWQRCREGQ